jgi:hypothetical protein
MLDTFQSLSLLTLVEIVGPLLLAAGLIWGILRSGRRARRGEQSFAANRARPTEADPPAVREGERTSRRTVFAVGAIVALILIAVVTVGPRLASKSFHEGTAGSPGNPERPNSEPIRK